MKLAAELPDLKRLYLTDSEFHTFVDQVRQYIRQMRLSPSEVRAAAMFAVYLEESESPGPKVYQLGSDGIGRLVESPLPSIAQEVIDARTHTDPDVYRSLTVCNPYLPCSCIPRVPSDHPQASDKSSAGPHSRSCSFVTGKSESKKSTYEPDPEYNRDYGRAKYERRLAEKKLESA